MLQVLHYGLLTALAIALLVAAFTDIRRRQIDNWLNAGVALGAPVYWYASGLSLWPGVALQVGFALLVAAALIGLWSLRVIGGGDIKLLIALSLWMAPMPYFGLLIVMALTGGVLTVALAAWHVARRSKGRMIIPYGVAIACGGLWTIGDAPVRGLLAAGGLA